MCVSEKQQDSTAQYLKSLSIDSLNEMQAEFISRAAKNPHIVLLSPTGSGKTVAFLIPLLHSLKENVREVQALIIVPSRELAIQIEQVFKGMKTPFRVSTVYGGHSSKLESNSLGEAPDVIIGTPGRLADHIERESFDPKTIQAVVLDEFDKSLQMGFHEQLKVIFGALNGQQRHLLTSATVLKRLPDFLPFVDHRTVNFLKDVVESKLELKIVHSSSKEKGETLMRLVAGFQDESCIVFCNHRDAVDRLSILLNDYDYFHSVLHGGLEQIDREKNLIRFRSKVTNLLIATDLASRGLDIPEIKHVVHYQLPPKEDAFIHRNGRTARMHAEGMSYLILANDESRPEYIAEFIEEFKVGEKLVPPVRQEWTCLYVSAGKKDKVSKGDIVGMLTKKGGLTSAEMGLITIMDFASYVAVKSNLVQKLLPKLKNERVKKVKVKVEEAN
ncbi:DbpA RNA binding domain-containing protein [Algoriphagus locisalis]|uniref:DbpA RNA binding domain-containing protein n=1 Tax=Algoriphagus locisalis TaxID=305507 RepID=A0A1I7BGT5_9BACT|nr:DbpA RNA binding domain-containing protein [Algoriphagus locisalis]